MTKLLIKRFIKDYENTQNSDVRTAYGKFSSIVGIVCNAIPVSYTHLTLPTT